MNKRLRGGLLILVDLAVPAYSREHDAPQVAFQQSVRLGQGVIQPGAFFKFVSIHVRPAQHFLSGPAALGAHRIKFKNNSGCSANRQFDVLLSLSHADRIALQTVPRYVTKADSSISVCLTSSNLESQAKLWKAGLPVCKFGGAKSGEGLTI
jgi:hypothetical protein